MTQAHQSAAEVLFDAVVGDEANATYHPKNGESVSCRVYQSGRNRADTHYSDVDVSALEVYLLESEVGSSVKQGDMIEYGGKTYRVSERPRSDGYVWTVALNAGVATA